ncbi:MAG: signal peptidase II [Alphaproteobacteria bacterium]|nr:signal peptidase II [Alphaproteobacteria bacterium]
MRKYLSAISIVFGVILIDQLAKGYLLHLVTHGQVPLFGRAFDIVPHAYIMTRVTSFFNIVFTWNPGTSFSLFRTLGESAPIVLIVITGIIIGALGHYLFARADKKYERVALSLIIGGAIGNLIDRIRFGAVVDFLDFHAFGWHWPAFNFADVFISIGVAVLVAGWLFNKRK